MKKRTGIVVGAALAGVALSGCSSAAQSPETTASAEAASTAPVDYSQQYLDIVCPWNQVFYAHDDEAWGDGFDLDATHEELPKEYTKWAADMAKASRTQGRALIDAEWPKSVQDDIKVIARQSYREFSYFDQRAKEDVDQWSERDTKSSRQHANAVANVRLELDLPPAGKGCGKAS